MTKTIKNIMNHCSNLLQNGACKDMPFHNLAHTQEVINKVSLISNALGIQQKEADLIVIAACFHDTGYSETYKDHEEASMRLAAEYLAKAKYTQTEIDKVCSYIEATKMPQDPQDIYAEVLCDADLFHLGTIDFWYRNLLLRKEWELLGGIVMADSEWQLLNIKFLEEHRFKTAYGKDVLENGKQENLNKLKQLIRIR